MLKLLLIGALLGTVVLPGAAQTMDTPAASALDKSDQRIVSEMARANMAQIDTARLALVNSQNAEVKAYAQQMVDDHGKALADVTALAQNKGVRLPAGPDARHKALLARLGRLKGEPFDRAYMAQQAGTGEHQLAVDALRKGADRARDPDLKALAAKMLPTVEQHGLVAGGKASAR